MLVRHATPLDAPAITEIYNPYITKTHSTFETESIDPREMKKRMHSVQEEMSLPWYVIAVDQDIKGYAYATQWKARAAYRHTVETSVYLDSTSFGKGYGTHLYHALIAHLKKYPIHTLIAGISLPNDRSIALHEKIGFESVGTLKEVGYKFDTWIDVGYWQMCI